MKTTKKRKIINILYFIISLMLIFFTNYTSVVASRNYAYKIYRVFDIPKEGEKKVETKYINNEELKRIMYEIKINSFYAGNMFIAKVNKNFGDNFAKDLNLTNGVINDYWESVSKVEPYFGRVDRKTGIGIYKGYFPYRSLNNGINYIVLCYQDFRLGGNKNVVLRCEKPERIFYYIKEYQKVVSKEEYNKYLNDLSKRLAKIRFQELSYIDKYNKYFDENKVKKSRFKYNSRIKTHQELQKLILDNRIRGKKINTRKDKIDMIVKTNAQDIYKYDDNDKVFPYQVMEDYVRYTIKEYLYQRDRGNEIYDTDKSIEEVIYGKTTQDDQSSTTTATQNQNSYNTNQNTSSNQSSSNNVSNTKALEEFKIKNAQDRVKAIDFSKKLLKALEKYRTKEKKIEKIQYLRDIINTKYTPDKYKNQNLIGYVKDYLDIVEYAIKLQ